jgi:arylsulfatase A-like enzyme
MINRFNRALGALVLLGLVQALLETLLIATLYRDLLFAPYRFFTIQIYDASTKLYFLTSEYLPLPSLLSDFIGQGFVAKFALFPELAAINTFIAALLALFAMPLAGESGSPARRVVLGVTAAALILHVAMWLLGTKIPLDPTFAKVAANLARNALFDGAVFAVAIAIVSALITLMVLSRRPAIGGAVATAFVVAGLAIPVLVDAARTSAPTLGRGASAPGYGYNVILISIDSLRADRMGLYGHDRDTSPAMSQLAAGGTYFESMRATTSWTLPSHMSILTGRSLLGHGVVSDDRRLTDDVPTLAESFSMAGYNTGAVVSAPYVESRYGFGRGFDEYDDTTIAFATNNASYKSVTAPKVNETAEAWIAGRTENPFFLFLHYWDVHYDFAPGPPYDTMFDPDYEGDVDGTDFYFNRAVHVDMDQRDLDHVLALYDGEIRLVDDHIAKLRAALARMGVAERTIIVVVSDHGEEFFEHGRKGHHRTLYEEVLHVPLIVYVPNMDMAVGSIADSASTIDIMPTLLGLTGLDQPAGLEGVDFTDVMTGVGRAPERTVYGELYRKGSLIVEVAAINESSKIIHHFNHRSLETFDLASDPGEREQLSNVNGEASQMLAHLADWLTVRWKVFDGRLSRDGVESLELDQANEDALRALGYIE